MYLEDTQIILVIIPNVHVMKVLPWAWRFIPNLDLGLLSALLETSPCSLQNALNNRAAVIQAIRAKARGAKANQ